MKSKPPVPRRMSPPKKVRPNLEKKQAKSHEDTESLIQDLQVHQVELEAQNLELRRVRLEQEKLARELSVLYDFAPVGYLSLDSEGRILRSNLAFSSMVGIERKFLQERNLYSLVADEDKDVLFLHLRRLFKRERREKCQLRLITAENKVIHVQIESSFDRDDEDRIASMTSVSDISHLIEIQKALKKSEEKFRTLADHAPDIIVRFDRDYRHLYVNPRTEEVLGIPKDSIMGKTNRDLGFPEDLVRFWHKKIDEVISKKEKLTMEFSAPTSTGDRNFEGVMVPECDDQGHVVSVMVLTRDVTHFKETEQKISQLNTRLEEQARELEEINEELRSFTYSVSHDLRAPIRAIKGFAEALEEDFSQDFQDEAKAYLRRISRASIRMTQIIDSLLVLSRVSQEEIKVGWVDLSRMAREFCAELQNSRLERKVEFVIQDGLEILGDSRLMGIAVQNLLRNAWKFTRDSSPARIEFGIQNDKDEKIFFVKDNGVGFDMTYAHKLFMPFQRLHSMSEFPGAGVGLATVQRIIRKHNGTIWAEAEEGKGATFYFKIQVMENKNAG
jgi:PAS domain S-box-containing protein